MRKEKKSSSNQFKFSVFIAIAALILITFYITIFQNLNYKSGLEGNAFYYLAFLPWGLLLLGGFILLCIGAIVNTLITIIKATKMKKVEWSKLLLTVFPLLALSGTYLFFTVSSSSETSAGAWDFLRGYEKWVGENVDITAIQEWLVSLPPEYSGQSFFEAITFPEELPETITKLDPYHMNFSEFKDGKRSVTFEWGSGLGHFGIVIGLPGMETPEGEELIKHTDYDYEFRRPIQSGVYIFDRG